MSNRSEKYIICRNILLIYYGVVSVFILINPWFRTNFTSGLGGIIVVDLVFIALSIAPAIITGVVEDSDENEGLYFISIGWHCLFLNSITLFWIIGWPNPFILILLYPLFGTIFNIIPFGIANLILMIGCPTVLGETICSLPESRPDFEIKDKDAGRTYEGRISKY